MLECKCEYKLQSHHFSNLPLMFLITTKSIITSQRVMTTTSSSCYISFHPEGSLLSEVHYYLLLLLPLPLRTPCVAHRPRPFPFIEVIISSQSHISADRSGRPNLNAQQPSEQHVRGLLLNDRIHAIKSVTSLPSRRRRRQSLCNTGKVLSLLVAK